jgi:hypothetical protein
MIRKKHHDIEERGEGWKGNEPTDTTVISITLLIEESVGPSLDVRGHRTNKRPLLRLVHPQNRRAD